MRVAILSPEAVPFAKVGGLADVSGALIKALHAKAVDSFLNGLSIIPIFSCVKRYPKEKVRLRKIGKPMNDEFDLLIGVTAIEHNLTLVTDNVSDFERLDGIRIENWFKRKENSHK